MRSLFLPLVLMVSRTATAGPKPAGDPEVSVSGLPGDKSHRARSIAFEGARYATGIRNSTALAARR
jgi:hypothetical protein